jgi:hypothetical protein
MDAQHADTVSWSVADETQLKEALAASLAVAHGVRPEHARLAPAAAAALQPSTYHVRQAC